MGCPVPAYGAMVRCAVTRQAAYTERTAALALLEDVCRAKDLPYYPLNAILARLIRLLTKRRRYGHTAWRFRRARFAMACPFKSRHRKGKPHITP